MTKRSAIPKATQEAVLKEYRHKCAVCGEDRPQLHHIDENPANNDPLNLLPLCPNCHLSDQHNPTSRHEPDKLRIFRKYKDPAILSPQFQAIFKRIRFLHRLPPNFDVWDAVDSILDLVSFVRNLEMGAYYANQIKRLLLLYPVPNTATSAGEPIMVTEEEFGPRHRRWGRPMDQQDLAARMKFWAGLQEPLFAQVRPKVFELLVELLRFQRWHAAPIGRTGP